MSWTVAGATSAVVAAETSATWSGGPAGLTADVDGSASRDFAVVSAAESNGAWTWTVLPMSTGTATFVPRFKDAAGGSVAGAGLVLAVGEPTLPADADVAGIKGPAAARPALWPWLLAAALLLAAWKAAARLRGRARPGGPAAPAEPPLPPETRARRDVAALLSSGLWEKSPAAYYLRLTTIVRAYLEARYSLPVTAMTSAEAARLVRDRSGDLKVGGAARELLERADLVKFARVQPAADEGRRDADTALSLVDATTPKPAPEAAPK